MAYVIKNLRGREYDYGDCYIPVKDVFNEMRAVFREMAVRDFDYEFWHNSYICRVIANRMMPDRWRPYTDSVIHGLSELLIRDLRDSPYGVEMSFSNHELIAYHNNAVVLLGVGDDSRFVLTEEQLRRYDGVHSMTKNVYHRILVRIGMLEEILKRDCDAVLKLNVYC